ncbi:hypothetical protein DFH11DRAFT_1874064 [Phellopilus nigrolimitatus]|nr:hypothetical protein DFH11DRAFT_1874064 [Phellopilus nigrolimitatus]
MSDSLYTAFAAPNFDANEYANAILAGEPFPPPQPSSSGDARPSGIKISKQASTLSSLSEPAKEDISVAISKLTVGIDDVSKQLKNVTTYEGPHAVHRSWRTRDASSHVSNALPTLSAAQHALLSSQRRLEGQIAELARVSASESIGLSDKWTGEEGEEKRESWKDNYVVGSEGLLFSTLLLSLHPQAKMHLVKVDEDSETSEILFVQFVPSLVTFPPSRPARSKITSEMEMMVVTGLATLNRSLLASSLQTSHNLRVLPNLVQFLLSDLTDSVDQRIRTTFDISRISKEVNAKDSAPASHGLLYRSRVRTEPTNVTAPQWTAALWSRLEGLIEELADCCIKVYTLEKVLQLKKDTVTQTNFMDEAMKVLENKPSATFWTVLARTLERQCKDAARSSTFMQQTLMHTDTIYTQERQSPETILILRALSVFEQSYLQRSANRLNEVVAQSVAGGARSPPAMGEGIGIARTAANELDSAKFDPLLVKAVAKNVQTSLELLLTRLEPLVVRDRWATSLLGPVSTPQQAQNAQVATCLYHCATRLSTLEGEYSESVTAILQPSIKEIRRSYDRIVDPLLVAIRRELGAIVGKLRKLDLGKAPDASAGMGGPSTYMKDLVDKLTFIKTEVLAKFNVGDAARVWVSTIVKNVIRSFVLNASIAKPLGEGGKLQLTGDMTEMEFALGAFMVEGGSQSKRGFKLDVIGDDYRALRAMRPLLFLDNSMLASPENTLGLPPLIVLHHILVRSPLPLPHSLHGWSESEYVRWVDEHSEEEALTLVDGVLTHWEKVHDSPTELDTSREYLDLARIVLANAKRRST